MRPVTLYIATSQDGFIAGPEGSLEFLEGVHLEGEDYGYHAFLSGVDTVVVGRKTYASVRDMGMDYPHTDKQVFIYSRTPHSTGDHTQVHTGSPTEHVRLLKSMDGQEIYCEGGAEIAHQLLEAHLIDRIILSTIPVRLEAGTLLFEYGKLPAGWRATREQIFPSGLLQTTYERA